MEGLKPNDSKLITIYDIAREAGVSPSTVSRVLTSNANVRQEKKERILELIDKYNFKPNALARGLADTRSKVIGIIAADIRNPYYAEVFVACEMAARKCGYTVLLCNSLGKIEQEEQQLEKLEEQRVDAIIQLGGRVDDLVSCVEYVERVNRLMNKIPVVITGKLDGTRCYQVKIDAMKTMELLMEYLISLKHTQIALIGGRMDVASTYEKFQRYKQILSKYSIPFCPELISEDSGYVYESGYNGMNKMFDKGVVPTAVIAINDFSAAGVIRSIAEHGYRIPQDISVVTYDNTYITDLIMPRLTSIDYNYKEFGRKLIETAVAAVEGREQPLVQLILPTLAIRETSGPPRETGRLEE
ncbi:LacI family transcriptional regulator [Anaerotaenia torta]|uniref:LacI family DNA-binding transcriptional regulator n=1 Tax=Anaerotaenia torta TaxID=433293 RepID=UPI003D1B99F1